MRAVAAEYGAKASIRLRRSSAALQSLLHDNIKSRTPAPKTDTGVDMLPLRKKPGAKTSNAWLQASANEPAIDFLVDQNFARLMQLGVANLAQRNQVIIGIIPG
jgi:hypothetical protein